MHDLLIRPCRDLHEGTLFARVAPAPRAGA